MPGLQFDRGGLDRDVGRSEEQMMVRVSPYQWRQPSATPQTSPDDRRIGDRLQGHERLRGVRIGAQKVHLTPTEWGLLDLPVRHSGRLVTQWQLLSEVWGPAYLKETHYLRVYFAQLRRKLEPDPSRPRYLVTEPGMGYRFEP
jgi:DNA-binding response OmpR family regulator